MSKWTEPLPKHTKLNFYECYAKIVLEDLYPTEFFNLEINDKPDLQMINKEYGIEVTNGNDKDDIKAEKLYTDLHFNRIRDKSKTIKEIEKCGSKLEDGFLIHKPGVDSFDLILKSFNDKLSKLNNAGYKYFKRNCLFVFSDIYADEEMIIKAIKDMQDKQYNKHKQFYKVFVLVPGACYCLNLYDNSFEIKPIDSSLQVNQSNRARTLVEAYENR